MPRVVIYRGEDGSVPLLDWMKTVGKRDRRIVAKCWARLDILAECGNKLRRPVADYLRDGVYELRLEYVGVNYRILYFFSGSECVVASHGLTKESRVPDREIDLAIRRKQRFESDPERFSYEREDK